MDSPAQFSEAIGKAIDAGREFGGWVSALVGPTLREAAGVGEDWTKYFRWRNGLVIRDKVEKVLEGRNAQRQSISPSLALPILEAATLSDDEVMQDLWSQLLANAMDVDRASRVRRQFTSILRDLEPIDVAILLRLATTDAKAFTSIDVLCDVLSIDAELCTVAAYNLIRLGCVESSPAKQIEESKFKTVFRMGFTGELRLTPLGRGLLRACSKVD